MRRTLSVAALLALGLSQSLAGQLLTTDRGDTLAILTGRNRSFQLQATSVAGVSAYSVTVFYDQDRLTFIAADSVVGSGLTNPTVTTGTNQITVADSGTGSSSSTVALVSLRFQMDSAATEGSLVSFRVNSMRDFALAPIADVRTDLLDVCQAVQLWGDLDGDRTINSRDALIAITYAVGLPIGGFDGTVGDVDSDFKTTSRDALFILSEGIGLSTPSRTADERVNNCAPLFAAPLDFVFRNWTNSVAVDVVPAGDTLATTLPLGGSSSIGLFSWAPDGSIISLSRFVSGWNEEPVYLRTDGSGADTLFLSGFYDRGPAWSADGTQIALWRGSSSSTSTLRLWIMDVDGSNLVQVPDSNLIPSGLDINWSPVEPKFTLTGYGSGGFTTRKMWTVNGDGTGLTEIFPNTTAFGAQWAPEWSPAGDSLVFRDASALLWKVAAVGDTGPARVSPLNGIQSEPFWTDAGIVFFTTVQTANGGWVIQEPSGRIEWLRRPRTAVGFGDMRQPTIYVSTVVVTPAVDTVQTDLTITLSAAVTNSDNSSNVTVPVTWISRNPSVASVDSTGTVLGLLAGNSTYIVATTRGWRSDSALVVVQ